MPPSFNHLSGQTATSFLPRSFNTSSPQGRFIFLNSPKNNFIPFDLSFQNSFIFFVYPTHSFDAFSFFSVPQWFLLTLLMSVVSIIFCTFQVLGLISPKEFRTGLFTVFYILAFVSISRWCHLVLQVSCYICCWLAHFWFKINVAWYFYTHIGKFHRMMCGLWSIYNLQGLLYMQLYFWDINICSVVKKGRDLWISYSFLAITFFHFESL